MVKSAPPPQNKWQNRAEAAIPCRSWCPPRGEGVGRMALSLYAALGTPNTDSPGGYVPAGMGPPQACQSPYVW